MLQILLFEDNDDFSSALIGLFKDEADITLIYNLDNAHKYLNFDNLDINKFDLIIMDACLSSREPDTMPIIEKIIDKGYQGDIIAASNSEKYSKVLMKAGATIMATKTDLTKKIREFIS